MVLCIVSCPEDVLGIKASSLVNKIKLILVNPQAPDFRLRCVGCHPGKATAAQERTLNAVYVEACQKVCAEKGICFAGMSTDGVSKEFLSIFFI